MALSFNLENKKQIFIIVLAILLGLVAAFLTSQYVQTSIQAQTKLLAQEYEKRAKAEREALMQEVALRQKDLEKRFAEISRQQQEQFAQQQAKMTQSAQNLSTTAFSLKTPPGKRAFTIMIDPLSAVGGLLNPGDFVDIVAQINTSDTPVPDPTKKITTLLFQNIQVLAVNTIFEPAPSPTTYDAQQKTRSLNVTLALTPEEVGLMAFVQEKGKLQLTLRSPAEQATQTVQVASWGTLAEYVLEHQGAELDVPKGRSTVGVETDDKGFEAEPVIQIFRGGQEL